MLDVTIFVLPFSQKEKIKVIDLGCGTGTLAKKIKENYPYAKITCLDISEDMIKLAKVKLNQYSDIKYQVEDLHFYEFEEKYDVIISSLALHHLEGDDTKKNFLKKIHDTLSAGGAFYNADVALGATYFLQDRFLAKWIEFMRKNYSLEEIKNVLLPKYYHEEIPTQFVKQIQWLIELGFIDVDVIWKYYNFVVYGGLKSKNKS
jgi:tRNA (cmo5U34)-methyltransferase